jgi:hypothetical protein
MSDPANPNKSFWTVAILLVVCALIAFVLSHKVLPGLSKFGRVSQEIMTRNDLQTLRGELRAQSLFSGRYPETLDLLRSRRPADRPFPVVRIPHHPDSDQVTYVASLESNDAGGWGYVSNPRDPHDGRIFVNCTHEDSEGTRWMEK